MCHLGMRHADVHTHGLRVGRKGNEINPQHDGEGRNAKKKKTSLGLDSCRSKCDIPSGDRWTACSWTCHVHVCVGRSHHQIHQTERGANKETLLCLCFSIWAFKIPFAQRMRSSDKLFTFLDDVHVVSPPNRTQDGCNILEKQLWTRAGIQLHTGKTRVWNREGTCPPGIEELGDEVWSPSSIKILGTLIGSPEFVRTIIAKRLEDEGRLGDAVAWVPDLQCSCCILLCAGPRCCLASLLSTAQSRRHDAHGRADGGRHWNGRREEGGSSVGLTPNAIGRSRIAERGPMCPRIVSSLWRQTCSAPIVLEMLKLPLPLTGQQRTPGPLGPDDFAQGQLYPRRHWPGSAVRLGQLFVRTSNSET